jgi:transcriptional regulator with XRE-family HTH domain
LLCEPAVIEKLDEWIAATIDQALNGELAWIYPEISLRLWRKDVNCGYHLMSTSIAVLSSFDNCGLQNKFLKSSESGGKMDEVVKFGFQVRDRRKQEKLSQGDLAQQVEISRTYLSQIERGEATNLSWNVRQRLCEVLGIPVGGAESLTPITRLEGLPESLQACATRLKLPPDDVKMLANLKYRGKQPDTSEKWEMLYNVIKMTVKG